MKYLADKNYPTVLPPESKEVSLLAYQTVVELNRTFKLLESLKDSTNKIDKFTFYTNTEKRGKGQNKLLMTVKFVDNKPTEITEGKHLASCEGEEEFLITLIRDRFSPYFLKMA